MSKHPINNAFQMKRSTHLLLKGISFVLLSYIFSIFATGCAGGKESQKLLVWPPAPDTARIRFIQILANEKSLDASGDSWLDDLTGDDAAESLVKPYGVISDGKGKVYVSETSNPRIFIFDLVNKKLMFTGNSISGAVRLPLGLALDSADNLYVADGKLKTVLVFNRSGDAIHTIGGQGDLLNPVAVATDQETNRVYIVDSQAHLVKVYSMKGEYLFSFGKRGTGNGEFNFPTSIAIGKNGLVYIVDTLNGRVEIFDKEGKFISTFGSLGDALGQFTRPKGIALDNEDNIYVVDAAFNNYQIFNSKGQLLLFVGSMGQQPGMFWLPAGICIDKNENIFVADQMNKRVQMFSKVTANTR